MKGIITLLLLCSLAWLPLLAQETPEDTPATTETTTRQSPATMQPDISVIGDVRGALTNRDDDTLDDQLKLHEVEVVIGSKLYPGLRGDLVLAAEAEENFSVGVEEAYLTADQLLTGVPIGGRLGILRLPFGKANPVHPHQLPYIGQPAVIKNLLGHHFTGNGFEVIGLLPSQGSFFLQGNLGRWEPRAHEHEHEESGEEEEAEHEHVAPGFATDEALTLGRLWSGSNIGQNHEFELGFSGAFGRGALEEHHEEEEEDGDEHAMCRPDINLLGVDVTWRTWLPGERRLMLQGEAIRREEKHGEHTHRQSGYYLLGTFRPNHQYEFGALYDWSKSVSAPGSHENYISGIATRFLNETTFLRLQVKHGKDCERQDVSEVLAQIVFGFGPHSHVLQ